MSKMKDIIDSSSEIGVCVTVYDDVDFFNKVLEKFSPRKLKGHVSIGKGEKLPLEEYEFTYSNRLGSSPAIMFFYEKDRLCMLKFLDAKKVCSVMENMYGIEYFLVDEDLEYLISVNWYVIEQFYQ
ncbi:hypothetical protein [Bacterioplanoides sp.]|uniref:hypothetical protein n=1 Tax=Bacterioplanoides sp. TaxID=2066072 RepID=UPI003B00E70E